MRCLITTLAAALTFSHAVTASETAISIPMRQGSATTFYVQGVLGSLDTMDFMVDTGSGYMTINEETLTALQLANQAQYQRELRGVLANGSEIQVPVYRLSHLSLGGCLLNDVEAAVFPGKTRQILGLNALKKAGAFTFSFNPPRLQFSNCPKPDMLAEVSDH